MTFNKNSLEPETAIRTIVYIDGFNLYYRNLKNTPYKWLDIEKFCESLLLPGTPIVKIKYFTARIKIKTNSAYSAPT